MITAGTKVRIRSTGDLGTVAYILMAPPDYAELDAVSVILDKHRTRTSVSSSPTRRIGRTGRAGPPG